MIGKKHIALAVLGLAFVGVYTAKQLSQTELENLYRNTMQSQTIKRAQNIVKMEKLTPEDYTLLQAMLSETKKMLKEKGLTEKFLKKFDVFTDGLLQQAENKTDFVQRGVGVDYEKGKREYTGPISQKVKKGVDNSVAFMIYADKIFKNFKRNLRLEVRKATVKEYEKARRSVKETGKLSELDLQKIESVIVRNDVDAVAWIKYLKDLAVNAINTTENSRGFLAGWIGFENERSITKENLSKYVNYSDRALSIALGLEKPDMIKEAYDKLKSYKDFIAQSIGSLSRKIDRDQTLVDQLVKGFKDANKGVEAPYIIWKKFDNIDIKQLFYIDLLELQKKFEALEKKFNDLEEEKEIEG